MRPGTRHAQTKRRAAVETVLPPSLRTLGALPFTQEDHAALKEWLDQGGWPPGTMDIHALEGYLVALLVWPVEMPAGAWLPPTWGESGWKVPAKLEGPLLLDKFVALVSAFLQKLDNGLYANPSPYSPSIAAPVLKRPGERPDSCSWAIGFAEALQQHTHTQGFKYRSAGVKAATAIIARCASVPPNSATRADLARAVYMLAAERTSRGPLAPLDTPEPKSSRPRRNHR